MSNVAGVAVEKEKGGHGGRQMGRLIDKLGMQLCAVA